MNLYEFSQQNNYEMGILVSKAQDGALYEKIIQEAEHIKRRSQPLHEVTKPQSPVPAKANASAAKDRRKTTAKGPGKGFCIRCKVELTANPAKPYCEQHFRVLEPLQEPGLRREVLPPLRQGARGVSSQAGLPTLLQQKQGNF